MTYTPQLAYSLVYLEGTRWKQHRVFNSRTAALTELSSLQRRFPSRKFEMLVGDERISVSEVAPIPDGSMELMEERG